MANTWLKFESFSFFMEVVGLWSNPVRGKWLIMFLKIRAPFSIFIEIFQIISIFTGGLEKKNLQEAGFFSIVGIITSLQVTHFQTHQTHGERVLKMVDHFEKSHKADWEAEIFKTRSKAGWKSTNTYWWILLSFFIVYTTLPAVVDSIFGNIFESFPSTRVGIPLQGLINSAGPRTLGGISWTLVSIVWTYVVSLGHMCTEWGLYMSIVYIRIEMEIISKKISMIKTKINENEYYKASLKDIAQRHQQVLSFLDIMIEIFGLPIALQNTVMSICFCVNLYSMTAMEQQEDLLPAIQNAYFLILGMSIVYFVCKTGQALENQNDMLFDDLYDMPWYNQGVEFRKDLNMMIRQARMPFVIHYHQKAPLVVKTFMELVNTSYSYFMMLKSTVH